MKRYTPLQSSLLRIKIKDTRDWKFGEQERLDAKKLYEHLRGFLPGPVNSLSPKQLISIYLLNYSFCLIQIYICAWIKTSENVCTIRRDDT